MAIENGRISNFEGLVTLTLDRVILHSVVHHASTSAYITNFTETELTFVYERTYERMYARTDGHLEPAFFRATQLKSRPKN